MHSGSIEGSIQANLILCRNCDAKNYDFVCGISPSKYLFRSGIKFKAISSIVTGILKMRFFLVSLTVMKSEIFLYKSEEIIVINIINFSRKNITMIELKKV